MTTASRVRQWEDIIAVLERPPVENVDGQDELFEYTPPPPPEPEPEPEPAQSALWG